MRAEAAPGRDIVATGGVQLVQALVATGLVDEYRLFVFPVVVGRGARLFESEVPLRLLETRPFISGAVLLRYSSLATPAASTARGMNRSREMQPCERERLGQVRFPLGPGAALA